MRNGVAIRLHHLSVNGSSLSHSEYWQGFSKCPKELVKSTMINVRDNIHLAVVSALKHVQTS